MLKTVLGAAGLILLMSCATAPPAPPGVRADLAPAGKLRAGLNCGNRLVATQDAATGELRGAAVDLIREAGRRIDVPVDLVCFDTAAKIADALRAGEIDVGTLAYESTREDAMSFTAGYVRVEATYLVPPGSPIRTVADVDRDGVQVGVSANSAYEMHLGRTFKHAKLVGGAGVPGSAQLLYAGKVDVMAAQRHQLDAAAQKLPGSRVLDGYFLVIEQTLAILRGRDAAINYLREFVEEAKATGFVARSLANSGGLTQAPAPR